MMLRVLVATRQTFGFCRAFFRRLLCRPFLDIFQSLTLALDSVFFPAWRRVEVVHPLFLFGHPRSGTTFLHRLLTQTHEFVVFELWQMFFPALTARRLMEPLVRRAARSGRGSVLPKEVGHEDRIDSVEEEEMLFWNIENSQFLTLFSPLGFGDWEPDILVYPDTQPARLQQQSVRYFKHCLQRQILYLGRRQVITKMNYSAMRLRSLMPAFPDARIVYLVRSPLDAIASHLSLHRDILNNRWGLERIPAERLRLYYQRRYRYNIAFYRYMEDLLAEGVIPAAQVLTLRYEDMCRDLQGTVDAIVALADLSPSPELRARIAEEARAMGSYHRAHAHADLAEFGLSPERIVQDLRFVFDKYGFDTGQQKAPESPGNHGAATPAARNGGSRAT